MSAVPGLRATIQLLPMDVEAHFGDADGHRAVIALVQRVSRECAASRSAGTTRRRDRPRPAGLRLRRAADDEAQADKLVDKLLKLRIFADDAGKMNRSVQDVGGGLLIVSQFTLAADTSGGNRPSFTGAAPPALGRALYERVLRAARASATAGRGRRVRRRHAGAPGQRRAGDDPDARCR